MNIFLEKEKKSLKQEDPTLLFGSDLMTIEVDKFLFTEYFHHNKYPSQKPKCNVDKNSSNNQ